MKSTNKKNLIFIVCFFGSVLAVGLIMRFLPDAAEIISGGLFALIVGFMIIPIYFIPMIVSIKRSHPQAGTISIINLFLGWTLLGWVISLAWAASSIEKKEGP